jgi:hypothetical protein
MAPNLYEVSNSDVTTYYSTQTAFPSSPLHLSIKSSLHVISALTCDTFTLAQRQTRTRLPICNLFEKQWLPPPPMKGNDRSNTFSTHNGTDKQDQHTSYAPFATPWLPLHLICFLLLATFLTSRPRMEKTREWTCNTQQPQQPMTANHSNPFSTFNGTNDNDQPTSSSTITTPWLRLHLTLCFIRIATFLTSWLKKKRTCKWTCNTRQPRRRYPLTKPPGTRTKYGKTPTAWNIIYDPDKDEVLTWTNRRIRIYRRRSRRQFVYLKGKYENTFPRNAQPIKGHWQGSYFIVEHLDHWTNTPTDIPETCRTPQWQPATMDTNNLATHTTTSDKHTGNPRQAPKTTETKHLDTLKGNSLPQLASNTLTWHPRQHSENNPRDSDMSSKWHPQARPTLQWTKQHLDAYLALAEVLCEWNIDPG